MLIDPQSFSAPIYSIDSFGDFVGATGASRVVKVFDRRKGNLNGIWSNATKYETTAFHFASGDPGACWVGGQGSEVLYGDWKGLIPDRSVFLADSPWIGIAKVEIKLSSFICFSHSYYPHLK